jgi:hypothetical protein
MHLPCQKAFVLIAVLTTACHETTSPLTEPGFYTLESFNNQPLPTFTYASGGDTTTLFSAILVLDGASNAMIATHSRQVDPGLPPRDATDTVRYTYRVVGDSIAFDYSPPCPPNALCVAPPYGKSTSTTLTLYSGFTGAYAVYLYRLITLDPH